MRWTNYELPTRPTALAIRRYFCYQTDRESNQQANVYRAPDGKMRKCVMLVMLAIATAFAANISKLSAATLVTADGVGAAPPREASKAKRIGPAPQRAHELQHQFECSRFYWPCYEFGYYTFYGVWGPMGYWGLYRPYAREPYSWWKLP